MEALAGVAISVVTKLAEYLVKPTILEVKYCLCAKNVIQDLQHEKEELISERDRVRARVEQAMARAEEIEKPVVVWLDGVETVLNEVAYLEHMMTANNNSCFQGRGPTWRRYRLCKQITEKTKAMGKFKGNSNIQPFSHRAPLPDIQYDSYENFTYFESTKVAYDQLVDALKDDHIHKIGVYGMGGCGKTTLVRQVGKKARELNLFDKVILIVVSQAPDTRKIQEKMADMLSLELKEESYDGRTQRLRMRLIQEKRVLIILDDLWGAFDLRDIGIYSSEDYEGILKILITARSSRVCDLMDCQKKIRLDLFTEEKSWTLFKSCANIDDRFSESLDDVPRKLCAECKGVPVAIVTVASSLKGVPEADWEVALNTLKYSVAIDNHVEQEAVFKVIKMSYDYLGNEEVKLLLLMCSLFPEDHEIIIEDLIRYAVGLGLGGRLSLESARINIEAGINKLIASCLLMQGMGRKEYVRMHELIRHVVLWIAKTSHDHKVLVNLDRPLSTLVDDVNTRDVFGISSWYDENQISLQWDAPNLEILLLNTNTEGSMGLSESTFEGIKGLKVLSIISGFYRSSFSMPQSIKLLTNLRTLRLEGWDLGDISFIVYLTILEVLDLRYCSFSRLSDEIGKELKRLKLLALVGCHVKEAYNRAVGKRAEQRFAQHLPSNSELQQIELRDLPQLINLISFMGPDPTPTQFVSLHCLQFLQVEHCENLKSLFSISVYRSLPELTTLDISDCQQLEQIIEENDNVLEHISNAQLFFPNLKHVTVRDCNKLKSLFSVAIVSKLPKLVTLSISRADQLEVVFRHGSEDDTPMNGTETMLPNLNEIYLEDLPSLVDICHGFRSHAVKLQHLKIYECPKFAPTLKKNQDYFTMENLSLDDSKEEYILRLSQKDGQKINLKFQNIELRVMPELVRLFHGPKHSFTLQYLKMLKIERCEKLKVIFPASIIRCLPQLQTLSIKECNALQSVIEEDVVDWEMSNFISRNTCFPLLTHLVVKKCNNLKCVFPVSTSKELPMLESVIITQASQLKEVFGCEANNGRRVEIPKLKYVLLAELPNLSQKIEFQSIDGGYILEHNCSIASSDANYLKTADLLSKEIKKLNTIGELKQLLESAAKALKMKSFVLGAFQETISELEKPRAQYTSKGPEVQAEPKLESTSTKGDGDNGQSAVPSVSVITAEPLIANDVAVSVGDGDSQSQEAHAPGIRRELEQLVSENHLSHENLSLLTNFLIKHPIVHLKNNSFGNRYKGSAYNCLAELLKFLQTHNMLDVIGSSHSSFKELLQDVRNFGFDVDWLNVDLERWVAKTD